MRLLPLLLAGAAAIASTSANATVTVYTSLAAFTAATTAQGTDTFNDLPPATPLSASLNRSAGAYTYTVSDTATVLYGAGSAGDPWLSNDTNAAQIVFNNFASGVGAIGANFFGTDINGDFVAAPLGLTVTVTDASGTVTQSLISPTTSTFLGFVSTGGLSQLTVQATVPSSSYWATVNNLVLARPAAAAAVPESATWMMMLVGFGMMGASVRYRRRETTVRFA